MDILRTFTTPGSAILSPFAGSGNCLFAAANLKMPAIGFDLDRETRDKFVVRATKAAPGEYRTYAPL